MKHVPVLLREVLAVFTDVNIRTFFDGTLGAGGHAQAILTAHPEIVRYIGVDRDPKALELAGERLKEFEDRVELWHGSYSKQIQELDHVDAFLIDVGVSSMQFDEIERGFSFRGDAPLDMRMNPDDILTAEEIVNRYSEKELARIFFEYGEERRSRQVAQAIVEARRKKRLRTTQELVEVVRPVATRGKLHPATLIFQALRIVVNDELGELERGLKGAIERLNSQGRLAAISFHSLEDRIVKNVLRDAKEELTVLTKKPIEPTREEMRLNLRSRSAKLRAAEKK